MTPARRAVAAALLFLGAAALAGVELRAAGTAYRHFGLVEGLFALFLVFVLLDRRVWERPPGTLGWLPVAYGALANAQLLELLLPPPGVVEWMAVVALTLAAWVALGVASRRRLLASLAGIAVLLALLRFSVVPFLWARSGPAPGGAFGFGDLAESFRRLFVEYEPLRPAGQLLGVAALALWALGTRLLWAPGGEEEDWLAAVPEPIRRRLRDPASPS